MKNSEKHSNSTSASLVRDLRKTLGITQEKLAQRLRVSFPTVNRWENGRSKPSPLAMNQIEELIRELGDNGRHLLKEYFH